MKIRARILSLKLMAEIDSGGGGKIAFKKGCVFHLKRGVFK